MMQSDLFISSVAGPLLSVSSDFLFHVSSTLPPSFHYPCGLFVLVRSRRAESARLVLMRSCSIVFPSRKRATVSPVVVCRVVLSDRRARRQTKEGMLDQRLMRSRKCRREKFLGIPFYSTVAGTYIGFAVEQASIWDGSRLFTTGEQKKGWVSKGCFFDKGPFYLLFLRASNYYLLSRKNSFSHDWNCTLVERNVCRDSVITVKHVHTNFFVSNLYG